MEQLHDYKAPPSWLTPVMDLGMGARLMFSLLDPASYRKLPFYEIRQHCGWMGSGSLPMVCMCAVLISVAVTTQVVLEADKFRAQDISGAVIAVGLLREVAGLTISLAWCAKVAAYIGAEASTTLVAKGKPVGRTFFIPRYIAAMISAAGLAAFGLVIGFTCAAIYAPTLGVTSTADFLESARGAIKYKDIVAYIIKLGIVNPTIAVLCGTVCGSARGRKPYMVAANAVANTFVAGAAMNLGITMALYL